MNKLINLHKNILHTINFAYFIYIYIYTTNIEKLNNLFVGNLQFLMSSSRDTFDEHLNIFAHDICES